MTSETFQSKTVLVTGGTGSFGKTFVHRLLKDDLVSKVIVFSRDEWKQWEMKESAPIFSSSKIRYFLGDVRDPTRLHRAFSEVDIVVHAAALKQVPAAEYNPTEFIQTNVLGAMNVINAAIDSGVKKVVALSSDKAVNPINLYGATKLCSDKLFTAAKAYVGKKNYPLFTVVRYGNVLGSRGSLLPYWEKLIEQGASALPITDPSMTRFWLTLDDASSFVIDALCRMQGGEICIPKCPSINISDLARSFKKGMPHTIIGVRPGEKIHELLISSDEAANTVEEETRYIIAPHYQPVKGKKVEPHFVLASNHNPLFTNDAMNIQTLIDSYYASCKRWH